MKLTSLLFVLCLIVSPALVEVKQVRSEPDSAVINQNIPRLQDKEHSHTEAKWLVQTSTQPVVVTEVQLNSTETGLEIILVSPTQATQQPSIVQEDNTLIIDIVDAVLQLKEGSEWSSENPSSDIAQVQVTQKDANTIRITVTGTTTVPTAEVVPSEQNLVLSLISNETTAETFQAEEEIEIVVTENNNDFFPNTSTATRTDTPIFDIPQSIQVVPQRVIEERNATEVGQALETVPGVNSAGARGSSVFGPNFIIRGFQVSGDNFFRDGIPYISLAPLRTEDLESIEVLKGPASVLFGQGEPGGVINLITKKPLSEPFYSVSFTIGNYNTYQGSIDLSGPLNDAKTVKYRLNLSYENFESFRDFVDGESLLFSPVITWDISPNTSINFSLQYTYNRETIDEGIPALGTGIVDVPRNRFLGEDFNKFEQNQFNVGYALNHKFSENWSIRHALRYSQYDPIRLAATPDSFDEQTGELSRLVYYADGTYKRFFTNAEVVGKFKTGPIAHQLLFGAEYRAGVEDPFFQFSDIYPSINVFNPIYTGIPFKITPEFFRDDNFNRLAVYIQDQIDLLPNLKLLAGLRYDYVDQVRTTRNLAEPRSDFEQSDTDFSPRVGIVYQPIPDVALYASYSQSFAPSFAASRNADNSTFEPETGEQFEVGIKANLSEQFTLTVAAFDIRKQNVSTPDPDNPIFSIQTGEQTSRGVELYLAGEILPGWNLVASYTYLDAFVSKDTTAIEDNFLDNVPENQFSLWSTYEIQQGNLEGLGFGLGLFFIGERPGDLDNTFTLPSYFRTDAALFYKRDNWEIQLNVENLFDVNYFSSASYGSRLYVNPGAPFSISGKVTYRF